MFDTLRQDVRYTLRALRRSPGFTSLAVLTLAVTIGANTVVFTIVDAVLLRPLSYSHADRLVAIDDFVPRIGRAPTSALEFNEWRASAHTFDAMALLAISPTILTGTGEPQRLDGARVSASLFPMLGVSAALGRTFRPEEETAGRDGVVVLSAAVWRRQFGSDPHIVGHAITLNDQRYTVIGVLPSSFRFPQLERLFAMPLRGGRPELWMPFVTPAPDHDENSFACIARLARGVSLEQARDDLNRIQRELGRRLTPPVDLRADVVPLQEQITGTSKADLLFLWLGVGVVLVIACANLANLFLARASRRRREVAIRLAIGANRVRVIRQIVIESLAVAAAGAVVGAMMAYAAVPAIVALSPSTVPRLEEVSFDWQTLLFSAAVAVLCAAVVGVLPAFRTSRVNLVDGMRGYGTAAGENRRDRTARRLLVSAQVALTIVCVASSGLLISSFLNVLNVDRGFSAAHVLGLRVGLPPTRYASNNEKTAFIRRALTAMRSVPGVAAVGVVNRLPLTGVAMNSLVAAAGTEESRIPANERPLGDIRSVNPDYFRTLGIPLLSGRVFQDTDITRRVAVVSKAMAARTWPGGNPLGKQFRLSFDPQHLITVVGVAGDVRAMGLAVQPPLSVYLPYWQGRLNDLSFALRTSGDELALAPTARRVMRSLDPEVPIDDVRAMTAVVADTVAPRRFEAAVLFAFGVVAMLLAGIGVYGVLSQSVIARTKELSVRLALGATPSTIRRFVLGEAMRLITLGLIVGVPAAVATGVSIRGLLFGIEPENPVVLAAACGIIILAALVAASIPAGRAAAVDPILSLRSE